MIKTKYLSILMGLAAALLVSALSVTSYPAHAASLAGEERISTAAVQAATALSTPCTFVESLPTCESTDPTVTYYDTPTGNITDCSFVFDIVWGDGGSTTTTVVNPSASHHLVGEHTYLVPGTYIIAVNPQVSVGTCTATSSVHTFTLLPPVAVPPTGPTSDVTTITLVPAGKVQVQGRTVQTYRVRGTTHFRGQVVAALPLTQDCVKEIAGSIAGHKIVEEVTDYTLPEAVGVFTEPAVLILLGTYDAFNIVNSCNPGNVVKIHTKPIQTLKLHMKPVEVDKLHVKS